MGFGGEVWLKDVPTMEEILDNALARWTVSLQREAGTVEGGLQGRRGGDSTRSHGRLGWGALMRREGKEEGV